MKTKKNSKTKKVKGNNKKKLSKKTRLVRSENAIKAKKAFIEKQKQSSFYGDKGCLESRINAEDLIGGGSLYVTKAVEIYPYYEDVKEGDNIKVINNGRNFNCFVLKKRKTEKNYVFTLRLESFRHIDRASNKNQAKSISKEEKKKKLIEFHRKPIEGVWQLPYKGVTWKDMLCRQGDDDLKKINFALFRRGLLDIDDYVSEYELEGLNYEDLEKVDTTHMTRREKLIHAFKLQYLEKIKAYENEMKN